MRFEAWYGLYTQPRHEKKVVEHLHMRDCEAYLPVYLAKRRWKNGQKVNLELPLFPGYVFVKMSMDRQLPVISTPGVVRFVGSGNKAIPIPAHEIDALMNRIQPLKPEPHPWLRIGKRVRIKSGPLEGLEGFLTTKKDSYRFVLSMDLIMQSVSVEVDAGDVEPVPEPRLPS